MSYYDLHELVTDYLDLIESSADEDRFEAKLKIRHLSAVIEVMLEDSAIDVGEFYSLCGLSSEEWDDVEDDKADFATLTKLKRGCEIVYEHGTRVAQRPKDEKLGESTDAISSRPNLNTELATEFAENLRGRADAIEAKSRRPKFETEISSQVAKQSHGIADAIPTDSVQPKFETELAPEVEQRSNRLFTGTSEQKWVHTELGDVSIAIADVCTRLEILSRTLRGNNEIGTAQSPIGPVQKAMLLAMIDAMRIELTQPYVEQGRVRQFFGAIGDLLKDGLKKAISDQVEAAAGGVLTAGVKLVAKMLSKPGIDSLSEIPTVSIDV